MTNPQSALAAAYRATIFPSHAQIAAARKRLGIEGVNGTGEELDSAVLRIMRELGVGLVEVVAADSVSPDSVAAVEAERDAALINIVSAWQTLPEGRYGSKIIERWLRKVMAPAIARCAAAIRKGVVTPTDNPLRRALEPFAKMAPEWDGEPDSLEVELRAYDDRMCPGVSVADFRRAREALNAPHPQGADDCISRAKTPEAK